MVGEILNRYKNDVEVARLIPSSGGVFNVSVNGTVIFSKKQENNRFPEPDEILGRMPS